ncbi:MAG: response regulator transcription factor [Gammaproteobacteria bacterium]|jgi:two-component system response regulator CpxR|nr:response regulator transcription factor [Gammaproteobacteria bacterium]MBT3722219.1 response regulator transcription factor [Gammaproteobacteria bacterium]MBT4076088.1 response regulator transcription factor [Gammaproteobacteria bacterium]MBT4193536.1 response regulator transcription factor [Gammaproteobacteria bacterium]MBT4452197.1 response regulator transcription factor [Gammaproteobacteria bacterium]
MHILLVDDDVALCELLREYLEMESFQVSMVHDGKQALQIINSAQQTWDAILLDVMLPGMNGFDLLKAIRPHNSIPILMLTARGEDTDTVLGLELGADEYVAKPVSPRVLVARLRALIRRASSEQKSSSIKVGDLNLDKQARLITVSGETIELTGAEFNLLNQLIENSGEVVSREQLAKEGLGRSLQAYDRRIETHMTQIRRKLGPQADGTERIKTVRGAGYQYVVSR